MQHRREVRVIESRECARVVHDGLRRGGYLSPPPMMPACSLPPSTSITPPTIWGSIPLAARAMPMMSVVRLLASGGFPVSYLCRPDASGEPGISCNRVSVSSPHQLQRAYREPVPPTILSGREDEHELLHTGRRES